MRRTISKNLAFIERKAATGLQNKAWGRERREVSRVLFEGRTAWAILRFLDLRPEVNGCGSVFLVREAGLFTENAVKE